MSKEIVPAATIDSIEAIAQECNLLSLSTQGRFVQAITLASGIQRLRAALTGEVMKFIMPLQGNALGFLADKQYPVDVVKDCLIEAILRGANPIGNEFNIISKRAYMAQAFFVRMVGEFPGLTDLKMSPGVPRINSNSGLVPYRVDWKLNGKADFIDRTQDGDGIPVRVNAGQGPDAVLGKAKRKILALVYERLTGSAISTPDGEVDGIIDVTPRETPVEKVKARLEAMTLPEPEDVEPIDVTPEPEPEPDPTPDEDGVVPNELTEAEFDKIFPTVTDKPSSWAKNLAKARGDRGDREWYCAVSDALEEFDVDDVDHVEAGARVEFLAAVAE